SDRLALMRQGRIVQLGAPEDVFLRPQSAFAADFMGRTNMIKGRLLIAGPQALIDTPLGPLRCATAPNLSTESAVYAVIRPQGIAVLPSGADAAARPNVFR